MVYNEPVNPEGSYSEASRDILDQVRAVEESLATLGVPSIRIPFTRDLPSFVDKILEKGIQHAFNLCESVDENPHHGYSRDFLHGIPCNGTGDNDG
jgi:hypothetical protein